MFEHLLKLFTEEPEKLKKAFVKCLIFLNTLLFSLWIYNRFIGNFVFIDLNNYKSLIHFFTSGRVLIALFVFAIAYYLLDFIVGTVILLVTYILNKITRWFKTDGSEVEFLMKHFDIVDYDILENKIIKGKNFELVYNILKDLGEESTINEIREYISFRYKTVFVSSTIIYYLILPNSIQNTYLDWLIPSIVIGIILLEIILERAIEYIIHNQKVFTSNFDFLLIVHTIDETLKKLPNFIEKVRHHNNFKKGVYFSVDSVTYQIIYYPKTPDSLFSQQIEKLAYLSSKNSNIILVLTKEFHNELHANRGLSEIKNKIIIFESIENLKDGIYTCIKELYNK